MVVAAGLDQVAVVRDGFAELDTLSVGSGLPNVAPALLLDVLATVAAACVSEYRNTS